MPRNRDFVPRADIELNGWQQNFVTFVNAHAGPLGVPAAKLAVLNSANSEWNSAWARHQAARRESRAATDAKNDARVALKTIVRELAATIQARSETTDDDRQKLGITVPDRTPTRQSDDAILQIPPPLLHVDWSVRSTAVIHYGIAPQQEDRNARPEGVHCCRIQYHIGGIPKKPTDWQFLADDTASPYYHVIQPQGAAKSVLVAYRACWISPSPQGAAK